VLRPSLEKALQSLAELLAALHQDLPCAARRNQHPQDEVWFLGIFQPVVGVLQSNGVGEQRSGQPAVPLSSPAIVSFTPVCFAWNAPAS